MTILMESSVKTAGYSYSVIRQHDDVIRKHWQLNFHLA
ncbi:hypothetical protein T4B_2235 [Trichinella pseudospiralis]|uniref:Uncharacterized protein n=1 Tax=Trichinella pseudospiralis TaxID=6337 RepID=A0A0V1GJR3_TRIPS|nr:hypothetical protein T4B_2235 [Trichinella pseudospiralis]